MATDFPQAESNQITPIDQNESIEELLDSVTKERDHFKTAFEEAEAERQRLQHLLKQLQRAQFGRKSERLDPDQLQLSLESIEQDASLASTAEENAGGSEDSKTRRRRQPARRNLGHLPQHLPRVEEIIDIADKTCPSCGEDMHQISVEDSERLDIVPAKLRVVVTKRPIYGCRTCGDAPVQAPAPDSAIPGGLPTKALLAHIAVAKYNDGLPLYRQCQIFARDRITLDRATLADWMGRTAWWLQPLHQLLITTLLASPRLFVDDTRLPVLAPGKGKTKTGALWGVARDDAPWDGPLPPAVAYVYTEDRIYARAGEILAGFAGVLQVDGWGGFKRLTGSKEAGKDGGCPLALAFCWSHARRNFYEIHQSSASPIAAEVLRRIAELYRIEDEGRGKPPDQRRAIRQEKSRPRVEALRSYIEDQLTRVSGKMPVATAMRYLLTHWEGLCVFLDDGRAEIDSNTIERLHRVIATGRKNALFAGSDAGARSWAIFASLIQTAKLNDIDPFAYLKDVLERIVSGRVKSHQLDCLLPWNWVADHPAI